MRRNIKTQILDNNQVVKLSTKMWQLYSQYYETDQDTFFERFQSNDFYAVYTDGEDIVGFTGLRIRPIKTEYGTFMTFYLGQSAIHNNYRGMSLIPKTCLNLFAQHFLRHPFVPIYAWCDALTFKPYLVFANALQRFYPTRKQETPPKIKALIEAIGKSYYGDTFDPETGTVQKSKNVIDDPTARVSDNELQHPDIEFFTKANPNYINGHGLITLAPITLENFLSISKRVIKKKLKK